MTDKEKLATYQAIVRKCQGILAQHIEAGGLGAKEALTEMARILGGPETLDLQAADTTEYEVLTPELRPRDNDEATGENLTVETLEHDETMMPRVLRVIDEDGRWAIYYAVERDGEPVRPI